MPEWDHETRAYAHETELPRTGSAQLAGNIVANRNII